MPVVNEGGNEVIVLSDSDDGAPPPPPPARSVHTARPPRDDGPASSPTPPVLPQAVPVARPVQRPPAASAPPVAPTPAAGVMAEPGDAGLRVGGRGTRLRKKPSPPPSEDYVPVRAPPRPTALPAPVAPDAPLRVGGRGTRLRKKPSPPPSVDEGHGCTPPVPAAPVAARNRPPPPVDEDRGCTPPVPAAPAEAAPAAAESLTQKDNGAGEVRERRPRGGRKEKARQARKLRAQEAAMHATQHAQLQAPAPAPVAIISIGDMSLPPLLPPGEALKRSTPAQIQPGVVALKRTAAQMEDDAVEVVDVEEGSTASGATSASPLPAVKVGTISSEEMTFRLDMVDGRFQCCFIPGAKPRHLLILDLENCRTFFEDAAAVEEEEQGRQIIPPDCFVLVCIGSHNAAKAREDWMRRHVVARLSASGRLDVQVAGSTSGASDIAIIAELMKRMGSGEIPADSAVTLISGDQDFNELHSFATGQGLSFQRFLSYDDWEIKGRSGAFQSGCVKYFFAQLRSRLYSTNAHKRSKGPDTKKLRREHAFLDFSSQLSIYKQFKENALATVPGVEPSRKGEGKGGKNGKNGKNGKGGKGYRGRR